MYGCDTWPLTIEKKSVLSSFERNVLRAIHSRGVEKKNALADTFGREIISGIIGVMKAAILRCNKNARRKLSTGREAVE